MLPKRKKNRTAVEDNNQNVVPTVLYGPPSFFTRRPRSYTMPNPALRKKQQKNQQPEEPTPEKPRASFCPNCGRQVKQNAKYCPQCGYELKKEDNLI